MGLRVGNSEQGAGVAERQLLLLDKHLYLVGKPKNPEVIGDEGPIATDTLCDFFLRETQRLDQALVRICFLDRIKFLTLDILDEGKLEEILIRNVANDCGNACKACELSGPPSSLARDQFKQASATPDEQGLNNPAGAY